MNKLKSYSYIGSQENGWYWKAKKVLNHLLKASDEDEDLLTREQIDTL